VVRVISPERARLVSRVLDAEVMGLNRKPTHPLAIVAAFFVPAATVALVTGRVELLAVAVPGALVYGVRTARARRP